MINKFDNHGKLYMQYIIDFVNTSTEEAINSYFSSINATIVKTFSKFEKVFLVETPTEPTKSDIISHVVRDDDNAIQLLSTTVVADATFGSILTDGSVPTVTIENNEKNWWKFFTLREPDLDAVSITTNRRGAGTTVYILDSGIELSHPEFVGADVSRLWSFTADENDTNGHGTAITSVVAGLTCGLTDAKVKAVKIFDSTTATKQSDMLSALDAIWLDVNTQNIGHAVVNCSWTIPKNVYIENKIQQMINEKIFFVAAAGNSGMPIDDVTPASMSDVITVGAYNNSLQPCDFSNFTGTSGISVTLDGVNSGQLDGWAPGEQIWAAAIGGSYHYVAGTSIAAGIHSAAMAFNLALGYNEPMFNDSTFKYYHLYGWGRQDLLDLSDPRYIDSINVVTTINDTNSKFGKGVPFTKFLRVIEGSKITLQLFNPTYVKQLEILVDLPDTFTVVNMGKLYGLAPNIAADYQMFTYPVRITYVDDTVEDDIFELLVVKNEYDQDTFVSTGDPELDYKLQAGGNCASIQPCGPDVTPCNDNCASLQYCEQDGGCFVKTNTQCYCAQ